MRLISLLLILALTSCKKEKVEPVVIADSLSNGMAVLCEGLFQQNNSNVSWVNFSDGSISNTLFQDKTSRQLGDTGNDMKRYGSKIYIVVNSSSTIEVLDAISFTSLQQIEMMNGPIAKQPRSIAFNASYAYVSCYDGYVDIIDTVSLSVIGRIQVGSNPEGMSVANNKLYVANSGGLNFPNVDSTLSVIDLSTHAEIHKIVIGKNPSVVISDDAGEVYVINRGDYGALPSSISRIDSQNDIVLSELPINATHITKMNDKFLIANFNYNTNVSTVSLFNPITETMLNPNLISGNSITSLYGINYNSNTNQIYITDAMGFTNTGYVRSYSSTGVHLQDYHVGLNPNKIVFYD